MLEFFEKAGNFILNALLAEFVVIVAGVFFVQFIQHRWVEWRYGGWKVIIIKNGEEILKREISAGKTRQIQAESADLAVFLKGVVSPYGWFNCDPLDKGKGVVVEDKVNRVYIIDLDKNPQPAEGNKHHQG